mmetsp:Transcript_29978/g.71411  ORF Transcript_29978/g.71411 Transcript_29978/m.71411 type:complete len:263 (-) Transcript_29978:1173-1961(-)
MGRTGLPRPLLGVVCSQALAVALLASLRPSVSGPELPACPGDSTAHALVGEKCLCRKPSASPPGAPSRRWSSRAARSFRAAACRRRSASACQIWSSAIAAARSSLTTRTSCSREATRERRDSTWACTSRPRASLLFRRAVSSLASCTICSRVLIALRTASECRSSIDLADRTLLDRASTMEIIFASCSPAAASAAARNPSRAVLSRASGSGCSEGPGPPLCCPSLAAAATTLWLRTCEGGAARQAAVSFSGRIRAECRTALL